MGVEGLMFAHPTKKKNRGGGGGGGGSGIWQLWTGIGHLLMHWGNKMNRDADAPMLEYRLSRNTELEVVLVRRESES